MLLAMKLFKGPLDLRCSASIEGLKDCSLVDRVLRDDVVVPHDYIAAIGNSGEFRAWIAEDGDQSLFHVCICKFAGMSSLESCQEILGTKINVALFWVLVFRYIDPDSGSKPSDLIVGGRRGRTIDVKNTP